MLPLRHTAGESHADDVHSCLSHCECLLDHCTLALCEKAKGCQTIAIWNLPIEGNADGLVDVATPLSTMQELKKKGVTASLHLVTHCHTGHSRSSHSNEVPAAPQHSASSKCIYLVCMATHVSDGVPSTQVHRQLTCC